MIYIAADNNLEGEALVDIDEMERAHPGGQIEVIVFIDRSGEDYEYVNVPPYISQVSHSTPDWGYAKIIRIMPDDNIGIKSMELLDLGEVNTGDPETLTQFIKYTVNNYPANNYALIIWDHGGGPGGAAWDYSSNEDYLTLKEIRQGVENAGVHLSIIGFDACLMATIDAAYEFRYLADYLIASEETEPGSGWPYDYWLTNLINNPMINPIDLSTNIVDEYIRYYYEENIEGVTLSVIDLSPLREQENINKILNFIDAAINNPEVLREARSDAQIFGGGNDPTYGVNQVDLLDLLNRVENRLGAPASSLINLIESLITKNGVFGNSVSRAYGISAHYPLRYNRQVYVSETSFSIELKWAELLDIVVNISPEISTESSENIVSEKIKIYQDYNLVTAQFGAAGPMDFDGDGIDEFIVFSEGVDQSNKYHVMLSVTKYFSNEGLYEVFSDVIDSKDAVNEGSPFLFANVMGEDVDSDGASEFFDTYSYINLADRAVYTSIDRYEYIGNYTVSSNYELIYNLTAVTAALGDYNNDGSYELAIGGYDIDFSSDTINGSLYFVDANTLQTIVSFYFQSDIGNFIEVSELASGDIDLDGWTELVIGYNIENMYSDGSMEPIVGKLLVAYMSGTDLYSMDMIEINNARIISTATGDIDSDGAYEIVFIAQYADETLALEVWKWKDNQLIQIGEWTISSQNALAFVQTYDLDGDGILEVLLTVIEYDYYGNPLSTTLYIYSYIPSQIDFEYEGAIDMAGEYNIPIPIDINGDMALDVIFLEQKRDGIYLSIGQVSNYVNPLGTLRGYVYDASGNPISNAYVEVILPRTTYYANTTTDENGYFEFNNVPAGTYQVSAFWIKGQDEIGYATELVNIPAGDETQVILNEETPYTQSTTPEISTIIPETNQTSQQSSIPTQHGIGIDMMFLGLIFIIAIIILVPVVIIILAVSKK